MRIKKISYGTINYEIVDRKVLQYRLKDINFVHILPPAQYAISGDSSFSHVLLKTINSPQIQTFLKSVFPDITEELFNEFVLRIQENRLVVALPEVYITGRLSFIAKATKWQNHTDGITEIGLVNHKLDRRRTTSYKLHWPNISDEICWGEALEQEELDLKVPITKTKVAKVISLLASSYFGTRFNSDLWSLRRLAEIVNKKTYRITGGEKSSILLSPIGQFFAMHCDENFKKTWAVLTEQKMYKQTIPKFEKPITIAL